MSDIVMRAARPEEAAALGELALRSKAHWGYDQAFLDACRAEFTYLPQDVLRRRMVVAEQGQRLVGMYSVDGDAPEGELGNLWLDPDVIGRGLGRRLWQHALDTARANGFTTLHIDADPNAEGFYLAMGAVKVGEVPSGSIPGRVLPQLRIDLTELPFRITLPIRFDDLDTNGHVQGPVYLAYADHARWACLVAAGIDPAGLRARGVGPVNLSTSIDFHRELTLPGDVEVSCEFQWGDGKTFTVEQHLRTGDGTSAATVRSVSGLLDLAERRLVADPWRHWLALADKPELLGLSGRGGGE